MSTTRQRNRSSILKRLSFRRMSFHPRKARAASSPVSVLDDTAFLLSTAKDHEDDNVMGMVPTFASSQSSRDEEEGGGTSLMQDLELEAEATQVMTTPVPSEEQDVVGKKTNRKEEDGISNELVQISEGAQATTVEQASLLEEQSATSNHHDENLEAAMTTSPLVNKTSVEHDDAHVLGAQQDKQQDENANNFVPTVDESQNGVPTTKTSPLKESKEEPVITTTTTRGNSTSTNTNPVTLVAGCRVYVCKGTYKGKYGVVEKVTAKKALVLLDDGGGKAKRLNKDSVQVVTMENSNNDAMNESFMMPLMSKGVQVSDDYSGDVAVERTTIQDAPSKDNGTDFEVGQTVVIIAGSNKSHIGRQGTIEKVTSKMVNVRIQGEAKACRKSKDSIQLVTGGGASDSNTSSSVMLQQEIAQPAVVVPASNTECRIEPTSEALVEMEGRAELSGNDDSQSVDITGGKYKGESGRLESATDKTVKVYIESQGKSVRVKRGFTTLGDGTTNASPAYSVGEEWRLPDSGKGGTRWGVRITEKLRTRRQAEKQAQENFLTHLFQDRLMVTETPMTAHEMEVPFDVKVLGEGGFGYELISSKIQNDGDASSGPYSKPKCVRLVYAQVTGPHRKSYSLQEELSRLGDFASLPTRKVAARLELLQSPAYKFKKNEYGMFALKKSEFELLTHESNDGCGFISDILIETLCSRGGAAFAKRALALQIRAVIPSVGIFKGMLMRKRIPPDEPQIQLMPSMKKVGPSREASMDDRAFLWITQGGMHPSNSNHCIGRLIDPSSKAPPLSFMKKPRKRVSDDIVQLWRTLKVPKDACELYVKKSASAKHLEHASLVGVADPTNSLPAGHIFVTGMKHLSPESLFVTRFPCNHPKDGRLLPNVTTKPVSMSETNWNWLNELPFGAIIFSDAEQGRKPLPELVAEGDLDGDLYFVCWNQDIIELAEPIAITDTEAADEDPSSKEEPQPDNNWLEKAQQHMIDVAKIYVINELIGKLYSLSKAAAIANEELITGDPDAMAFAAAYKHALQHGKHGGAIPLDAHLHDKLPLRLREHLASPQ